MEEILYIKINQNIPVSKKSITFKDIATAKAVLKEKLKTIYHTRISYPEMGEDYENREE